MINCEKFINKHSKTQRERELTAFVVLILINVFLTSQRLSLKTITKVIIYFIACRRIVRTENDVYFYIR